MEDDNKYKKIRTFATKCLSYTRRYAHLPRSIYACFSVAFTLIPCYVPFTYSSDDGTIGFTYF